MDELQVTQALLEISAHYPWVMGVLHGDIHPSVQKILDKHCGRSRIELATIISSIDNSDHSANSSPNGKTCKP